MVVIFLLQSVGPNKETGSRLHISSDHNTPYAGLSIQFHYVDCTNKCDSYKDETYLPAFFAKMAGYRKVELVQGVENAVV